MQDLEPLVNYAVIDEVDSYASPSDIANYTGYAVAESTPVRGLPDEPTVEELRSNVIDEWTLRPNYSFSKGGGSKNKGRKKALKRLTGPQRIEKHINIVKNDQNLAETPEQRVARHLRKLADLERKAGRPRKGTELRETVPMRIDPDDLAIIREAKIPLGEAVDQYARGLAA